jgi:hypothetical protein
MGLPDCNMRGSRTDPRQSRAHVGDRAKYHPSDQIGGGWSLSGSDHAFRIADSRHAQHSPQAVAAEFLGHLQSTGYQTGYSEFPNEYPVHGSLAPKAWRAGQSGPLKRSAGHVEHFPREICASGTYRIDYRFAPSPIQLLSPQSEKHSFRLPPRIGQRLKPGTLL